MVLSSHGNPAPRSSFLFPRFLAVVLTLCGLTAFAAPVKFDIPAQPALSGVSAFIKQSDASVTYVRTDLDGIRTNEVRGEMESVDALTKLVAATGLEATQTSATSFVLKKSAAPATGSVKGSVVGEGGRPLADVLVTVRETSQSVVTDGFGRFSLSSVKPGTYTLVATAHGYQPMHITHVQIREGRDLTLGKEEMHKPLGDVTTLDPIVVQADAVQELEKFEVTGSKLRPFSDRNIDLPRTINDVQPYYIFNNQAIIESGATDVEQFLKQRLTMNTTAQTNLQKTLYDGTGALPTNVSSVNLRGLGANRTLILVNGMRMAGVTLYSGGLSDLAQGQPNINGIPLSAIDRIEVLPSSAGAIYGANVEGGVINIVLKKAYKGGDLTFSYSSTTDGHGPSRRVDASFGTSFENGKSQLFITAQYSDSKPMYFGDRRQLYDRGFNALKERDPSFLGLAENTLTNDHVFFPPVGATPNIAAAGRYYPSANPGPPDNTYGPFPPGEDFGAGPTTDAMPYLVYRVQGPLTLKVTHQPLGGANPYIATIPTGFGRNSSPTGIIGGQWNLELGEHNEAPTGLLMPLGGFPTRKSIFATYTRQMNDKLQIHVDASRAEDRAVSAFNYVTTQNGILISANNPNNPFEQDVVVSFPVNAQAPIHSSNVLTAFNAGATLKLPFDWISHLDYQWSRSRTKSSFYATVQIDGDGPIYGQVSAASSVIDNFPPPLWSGAINPFTDTLTNQIDWTQFTEYDYSESTADSTDIVLAAAGPLLHLPWGEPRLSARLEHSENVTPDGARWSAGPGSSTPYPGLPVRWFEFRSYEQSRTVDSASAELDLPLFKSKRPFLRSLDVQFNVRNERSAVTAGSPGYFTLNPYPYNALGLPSGPRPPLDANGQPYRYKIHDNHTTFTGPAFSYKPFNDFLFRFSRADGYVNPTYAQLLPNLTLNSTTSSINDPKNPNLGRYRVSTYSGGNPALLPQTSVSIDAGGIWEPRKGPLEGLRVGVEYSKTTQHNLISSPGTQFVINNEADLPGLVQRDSANRIVSVRNVPVNLNQAENSHWDLSVGYRRQTAIGNFNLDAATTINQHLNQQLTVGSPLLEYVGFPNSGGVAKVKSVATVRWSRRNWIASWTVNYFGEYNQYGAPGDPIVYGGTFSQEVYDSQLTGRSGYIGAQGGNTVPAQTFHNLYVSYAFRGSAFGTDRGWRHWTNLLLRDTQIGLYVNNVFNTLPAFDAYYVPFYASPYGDIQLRTFTLTFKKSF